MLDNIFDLYRRIYSKTDLEDKINFKDDKQKYRTHAFLQSILYQLDQEDGITYLKGACINDGAWTMFPESLKECTNPRYIGSNNTGNNPNRDAWKEETFFFYNCKVENFFNSENTNVQYIDKHGDDKKVKLIDFNQNNFRKYQAAYNLAQDFLNGEKTIKDLDLPYEVASSISQAAIDQAKVKYCIERSNSPKKINELLVEISEHKNEIGTKVKALINSGQYKQKYQEALNGDMHSFKKFLFSCWYFIIHSLKFISFQESFAIAKDNYRKDYAEATTRATTSSTTKTFKEYISNDIKPAAPEL